MPKTRMLVALLVLLCCCGAAHGQATRWTEVQANDWYAKQPWLVGSNYIPANAINPLEMWQAETFDPQRIDLELSWAQGLGMNTMRVFLHDLPWQQDSAGFTKRIDTFLRIADKHHIRPIFVLFDSCWDPQPHLGAQHAPVAGVHNSGWVQSPGAAALANPAEYKRLQAYITGVVSAFADDPRVLAWDVWNEPSNLSDKTYPGKDPANKLKLVEVLLPEVFAWARAGHPTQPLTSGVWEGGWSNVNKISAIQKTQLEQSDIISFHNYGKPAEFKKGADSLQQFHRPIFCTEYMARPRGSTFQAILPVAWKYHIAAYNWGFVAGKTQTWYPWDSWQHPYPKDPNPWFHDIYHTDGTPYSVKETEFLTAILAKHNAQAVRQNVPAAAPPVASKSVLP